jgi:hypothetical protein
VGHLGRVDAQDAHPLAVVLGPLDRYGITVTHVDQFQGYGDPFQGGPGLGKVLLVLGSGQATGQLEGGGQDQGGKEGAAEGHGNLQFGFFG